MKKKITMVVSLLLVMALSIGGTLAYLTDKTDAIENTFTIGNVKIDLTETGATKGANDELFKNSFKMVPGNKIDKDPTVTVEAGSEACWLFVKIVKSDKFDDYIAYTVDDEWTALGTSYPGVYYIKQAAIADDAAAQKYSVLEDDQVTVKTTVTQEMMDDIADQDVATPTLTFTAYAIQQANIGTEGAEDVANAAAAWAELNP